MSQWCQLCDAISNSLQTKSSTSLFFFFLGPVSVLAFLRANLRKAEPFKLLKMLMIGPPRQGKTALLEVLQTGKASPFTPAECSISTSTWELEKPNGGKNNVRNAGSTGIQYTAFSVQTHTQCTAWCRFQTIKQILKKYKAVRRTVL